MIKSGYSKHGRHNFPLQEKLLSLLEQISITYLRSKTLNKIVLLLIDVRLTTYYEQVTCFLNLFHLK